MPPSELAMPMGIVAVTLPVFRSTRLIDWSPQLGTHKLPNPTANPEQGFLPTVMVSTTLLVFGSMCRTLSLGLFETHTDSASPLATAIQSGEPGYGNTASGLSRSMGTRTPGVLTPGLGAGLPDVCDCARIASKVQRIGNMFG